MTKFLCLLLPPLCVLTLTGCPPSENNDSNNNAPDPKEDMASAQDMRADREDMGAPDMPTAREDMSSSQDMAAQDMAPGLVRCVLTQPPLSMPVQDVADFQLTATLLCNAPLEAQPLSFTFLGNESSAVADNMTSSCEPQDDLFSCELSLINLPAPGIDITPRAGVKPLTISSDTLSPLELPVRFHMPWEQVKKISPRPASFALPANFARCGVDATARQLSGGVGIFSVMMNETNDEISLVLTSESLAQPHKQSLAVAGDDIMASDFEVVRTQAGLVATWWAYDDRKSSFVGVQLRVDESGQLLSSTTLGAYEGPELARIVDAQWGVAGEGDEQLAQARVLGVSKEGVAITVRLFDQGNLAHVESENDVLAGIPGAQVTANNTGIFKTRAEGTQLNNGASLWQTLPLEGKDGVKFSVHTFGHSPGVASVDIPTLFPVMETYTGRSEAGEIFVMLIGEEHGQALFQTRLDEGGNKLVAPLAKAIPANVGLERRKKTPFSRRKREQDAKRRNVAPRQGLAPHDLILSSAGDQTTMLGRWPWNWRDRIKSRSEALGKDANSSLDRQSGTPVTVTWKNTQSETLWVAPLLMDTLAPGEEASFEPGMLAALSLTAANNRVGISTAPLAAASTCQDTKRCRHTISHDTSGHALMVTGGTQNLQLVMADSSGGSHKETQPGALLEAEEMSSLGMENPTFVGSTGASTNILNTFLAEGDAATHMILTRSADGKTMERGRFRFVTGPDGPGITGDHIIESARVSSRSGGPWATIAITYMPANSQATLLTRPVPERMVFEVKVADMLASVGKDEVTVIDLSDAQPLVIPPRRVETLSYAGSPILLDPSRALTLNEAAPAGATTTTLAELTPEQATRTLMLSFTGEGCGAMSIDSLATGPKGEVLTQNLVERAATQQDCSDQEVILGVGDLLGDGGVQIFARSYADFTGRIKRIKIRRRRVGTGFKPVGQDEPMFELVLEELTVDLSAMDAGDWIGGLSSTIQDFNGDGIADVALTSGSSAQVASPTLLLFGDGRGGFLESSTRAAHAPTLMGPTGLAASGELSARNVRDDYRNDRASGTLTVHVCHL